MKAEYPIRQLCAVLEVGPSGYSDWCHRQSHPSGRRQEDVQLQVLIEQIFLAHRRTYGSPRIQIALSRQGRCHGRNRISRLMRQKGLWGRVRKRYRVRTTDSAHDHPVAPNRLAEGVAPTRPNQVWVADITYVGTGEGWLYVAGILDLYSRRLVGLAMGSEITTELTLAAWRQALTHRQPPRGLLFQFRSRGAICQWRLPSGAGPSPSGRLDESESLLL
jgi:transposase InsO family protein